MFTRFSRVSNGGGGEGGVITQMVRYFSKKRAEDVRRINPKVPIPEAAAISQNLYQVIKDHGPLNISSTWSHAQEASVDGINSKTHMKILLKWMRGRNMLKLLCHQVGSHKKFYYTTLPEDPNSAEAKNILAMKLETEKNPAKRNTNKKKKKKLRKTKG
ncbi:hypothetical protein MKW92_006450 [Papaver armeniacum]|nr:hypothetical protein MKW92_006450 [Papaver armeniacum]